MEIKLYKFSKRNNSTSIPTNVAVFSINVLLKANTSIYNPTFMINKDISGYNYLQWDNRYYYIEDVIKATVKDTWEINCNMDILATYRNDIKNSNAFISYATKVYDSMLPDQRLSMSATPTIVDNSANIVDMTTANGTYIVSYVTKVTGASWAPVGVAWCNKANVNAIADGLMSEGFNNLLVELEKQLADAKSALISCKYVPVDLGNDTTLPIYLASYTTPVAHGRVPIRIVNKSVTLNIPWQFSDFRNTEPYTTFLLYLPAYGFATLKPSDLIGKTTLTVRLIIDGLTGEAVYMVGNLARYVVNLAQDIPLGVNKTDTKGFLTSVGAAALGGLVNPVIGVGALFNAYMMDASHNVGTIGGLGSVASIIANISAEEGGDVHLLSICHNTNIAPSTVAEKMGRPLNQIRALYTCDGGYVQTVDASVKTEAPESIKERINSMMNGGIYLE